MKPPPQWLLRLAVLGALSLRATSVATQAKDPLDTLRAAARPGPEHRQLARQAGSWEARGRYWLPDGKTAELSAHIESTLLQEGRFLESRVRGTLREQPYEGRAILGYDTAAGEFVEIWFDSLGTGIHRATGTCEPGCRLRSMRARFVDPIWGRTMSCRVALTWLDEHSYRVEVWLAHEDGREFRQLDYTAKRAR